MSEQARQAPDATLLRSLTGSSLSRLPKLAERLVDQVWEDIYVPRGPVPKDDLWRSCHDNLASMLKTLRGAPSASALLETARSTGSRRAWQRCPLPWVQHAWRVGGQVMWEDFAAQAGSDDADELRRLVESVTTVWGVVEGFSAEMAATYQSVEQDLLGEPDRRVLELLDAVLDGTLDGRLTGSPGEAARTLGLPTGGPFVVIVTEESRQATLRHLTRTLRLQGLPTVWRRRGGPAVGIAAAGDRDPEPLRTALDGVLSGRTGLSPAVTGLPDVPEGRRLAELAMNTVPPGTTGVVTLDEHLPDALLISSPRLAGRLIEVTLGPLLALPATERDELLGTAEAWLRSAGSAVQAARLLYCHRNTVLNRLARIHRLTGLDLADTGSWSQVSLALSALRYQRGQAPGAGSSRDRGIPSG
ncbi:PucR family transcriptional regulator [Amycolatopsis rhizosphaerae]|nr:helix-turn-helix domain-containing protein [Amycolatopsis rhizosphaerae]